MARPQKFDTDDVLDRAMQVFWRKGYDDTSVQDLVDATGLNRGSLYNAFGDKAGLFSAIMERYRAHSPAHAFALKANSTPPRQWIKDFLLLLAELAHKDPDHKGCLVTNTAAGFYGCDPAMSAWVQSTLGDLEDLFASVIERGQNSGQITQDRSARSLARFFVSTINGINVLACAEASHEHLLDIVNNALVVLGEPQSSAPSSASDPADTGVPFPSDPSSLY